MSKEINLKNVILIFIILVLILANLVVLLKINNLDKQLIANSNQNEEETIQEVQSNKSEEEQELEKLQAMTERDRMEYYFYKFISYIHSEDYSKAYDLLYPQFKENYFKTEEEFKNYAIKTYPQSVGFAYNDIDRQGSIYVLIITVIDTNKKVGNEKSQRVVIQENNFNDFVLSFQII